jgi:iron complex outermembrane receptor protein
VATRYVFDAGSYLPGLVLGLGMTRHGKLPGDAANNYFTPSATVWDSQLSYRLGMTTLGLFVNNLTDKKYFEPSAYFGGGQVMPAPRRSVVATARIDF